MKDKAYFEVLGRQVAEGKYVSRDRCFMALFAGILIGALGMFFLMPSANNMSAEQGGGYKTPLDSAALQQQQEQQQEVTSAIRALESRLVVTPNNEEAWIQLGSLYFDLGNHEKAIEAYEKALAINPANPDVWVNCGVMYRAHQQFDKALEYFDKALAINPNHEFALFNSGVVLHNDLHDDAKAFVFWEKVATLNPQFKTPNGVLLTTILKEHYNDGQ